MRSLLPVLGAIAALCVAVPAQAQEVVRRALVVGANDGHSLLERLRYAEDDARRVAAVLEGLGGFDEVILLLGPSPNELSTTLARLDPVGDGDQRSLFVFYYSGHADEIGLQLGPQHLPYEGLKRSIRAVPADVHLGVLDACRSGAITRVKGASIAEPFLHDEPLGAEGEAWIAASAPTEDAQESELLQGSFFTYYLLSGLRGAADTGDGWVSLSEAYTYAYDRTVARTAGTRAGTQHPHYDFQMQGNGDLKLTEVRRATARVSLPADLAGEVAVLRLPDHTPIAEVAKAEGRAVVLALEPGRYLLRRRVEGGVQEVRISLGEGTDLLVDRWGDTVAEVASRKGTADATSASRPAAPEPASAPEPAAAPEAAQPARDDEYLTIRLPVRFRPDGQVGVDTTWFEDNPTVAGGLSVVPGLGQAYRGRWGTGAMFMGAVVGLHSIGWGIAPEGGRHTLTGPNMFTFLAMAVHGWAVADAVYRIEEREAHAARAGATLSLETGWNGSGHPFASGLGVDVYPVPAFSLGLDRSGVVVAPDHTAWILGTRVTAGPAFDRWRPALVASLGLRVVDLREGVVSEQPPEPGPTVTVGAGVRSRHYLTPRYFLQGEVRAEWMQPEPVWTAGLGLGVHLGH